MLVLLFFLLQLPHWGGFYDILGVHVNYVDGDYGQHHNVSLLARLRPGEAGHADGANRLALRLSPGESIASERPQECCSTHICSAGRRNETIDASWRRRWLLRTP